MENYKEAEQMFKQSLQNKGLVLDRGFRYKSASVHFLYYKGNLEKPDYSKINIVIQNQKGEVKRRMMRFDIRKGDYEVLKQKIEDVVDEAAANKCEKSP